MKGVEKIKIKKFNAERGVLCPIEFDTLPIDVKRVFYIYGVNNKEVRGNHSHYKTSQILICLNGKCLITCKNGKEIEGYVLEKPDTGLLIRNMIWDEQVYASKDTVLLVLSDTKYDKNDYIESWETYCKLINR